MIDLEHVFCSLPVSVSGEACVQVLDFEHTLYSLPVGVSRIDIF